MLLRQLWYPPPCFGNTSTALSFKFQSMNKRIRHLFLKYLNNTCTREEFEEVFDYINSQGVIVTDEMIRSVYEEDIGKRRKKKTMLLQVAASIMVITIAVITIVLTRAAPQPLVAENSVQASTSMQTARSESRYLLLPDSTQVWLNAASRLEVPEEFSANERRVNLVGEAYFDVKHADSIPFVITTGKVSTLVIGTAFNIKAYPDQDRVTVSVKRGKVNVRYSDNRVAVLGRGQQVSIETTTTKAKQKTIKEEETAAWQEGNLLFDEETLGDVLAYLEKVYDVSVRLEDLSQKNLQISTSFKREQGIENALTILCRLTDMDMRIEKGNYILKNKL